MINLNSTDYLEYISSGLFKSDCAWCHPRRIIDSYEIIFMHEGTAYISEGDIEYVLNKNDILILEPGKEHFGYRTSEENVSFSWIHFQTNHEEYTTLLKNFSVEDHYRLKTLFSQCLHTTSTPEYNRIALDLYTALIIEELLRLIKTASINGNYLAAQIKEYVRLNIEKNISVKTIADHFGYHENHTSRVFKATYNTLLKTHITNQKLEYTKNLLSNTLYSIKQISQMLSFKSENHFIKFFKYHTKMSPLEYRNTYCNTHMNKS